MIIKGFQKMTLLDFPGKVAATVFTGGCNMRCPFCHNAGLVLRPEENESFDEDYVFSYLEKRRGMVDGLVVTGGEPLLQKDIVEFLTKVKEKGFAIKLDTNGSFPEKLSEIIERKLPDYIAMDIKTSPERYPVVAGIDAKWVEKVKQSVSLLMNSEIDFEFRTTVVKGLHSVGDFEEIGKFIAGAPRYFLQSFVDSGDIISNAGFSAYSPDEMRSFADIIRKYVPSVKLRGI